MPTIYKIMEPQPEIEIEFSREVGNIWKVITRCEDDFIAPFKPGDEITIECETCKGSGGVGSPYEHPLKKLMPEINIGLVVQACPDCCMRGGLKDIVKSCEPELRNGIWNWKIEAREK